MLQREKLAILPAELARQTAAVREQKQPSLFKKILIGYMFFKVPLIRPEGLLNLIYPWLSPLWSKPFLFLYAVLGVAGLIFMSQQIELYLHTVNHLFTPRGATAFFLCLAVIKIIHEFGHALASKHHGIFVRRMGIAFMVFIPILYTDTTEAWKLPSKKGRLIIGAAGILTEICIAAVSLFFWSVLPDGIVRSLMFYMSGASAVSTIMVNLNPLMRYDGYYLLMDYLQISNLRMRAAAIFRYFRHRLFVDWQGPMPEEHPLYRSMAVFGFFTMLYRVVIFFSISLAIYHKVFKVLGVFLLFMQVLFMVILPLTGETLYLLKNRKYWGSKKRVFASIVLAGCLIALLFLPIPGFGKLPALFLFKNMSQIEAPGKGRIVTELPEIGRLVQKGDILMRLQDDKSEQELEKIGYDLAQTVVSVDRLGSGGTQGGYRKWLMAEHQRLSAEQEKIRQSLSQLEIRSPVAGKILDVNETLKKGSYISAKNYLITVGDEKSFEIRAYAPENIYRELKGKNISEGKVVFQDLETETITGKFRERFDFPVNNFPNPSLFDYTGGPVLSSMKPSGNVYPRDAYYSIIFDIPSISSHIRHGTRCSVKIKERESFSIMERIIRKGWRVLASEGFM